MEVVGQADARPALLVLRAARRVERDDARLPVDLLEHRKLGYGLRPRPGVERHDHVKGWLLYWNLDKPITYYGRRVARVDNRTLKKIAVKAGVDPANVNRYMLRHYMATRIRRVAGVSKEVRELWLGHADPKHRQTAWYESFDPDYLEAAMRGTDAIMLELNQLCRRRSLIAPTVVHTAVQLSVIEGSKTGT